MACVRHTAHVSNDKTHLEVTNTTSREVAEVLSTMSKDTLEAVVSRSHESSKADVEDSNDDSGSEASADKVFDSKSDATKKAKVVTAVGLTFDFRPSRVGKGPIRAMEASDILLRARPEPLAQNQCRSPELMKLWSLKTYSSLGFRCLRILP
jgi:hypothetical protein